MGARGPAPKRAIEGNPDAFKGELPPAPDDMTPGAAAEYERVREIGGEVFGAVDYHVVRSWAETVEMEAAVFAQINWPTATIFSDKTGAEYPDPKFNVWRSLSKAKMDLAAKLGFNPTDRARLLGGVEAKPAENPLLAEIRTEQAKVSAAAPAGKRPRGRPRKV